MAYTVKNFKRKSDLKAALKLADVPVYQPGVFGYNVPDGTAVYIVGPHYPTPHTWYAEVTVVGGMIPKGSKIR